MEAPPTRFAEGPDGFVAYQVVGEGSIDVLLVPSWTTAIDLMWEIPAVERVLRPIAEHARLIVFDKRGSGASDPLPALALRGASLTEHAAQDVITVLDTVDSERATFVGLEFGGWPAMAAAATHPARARSLVLCDTVARVTRTDDYRYGLRDADVPGLVDYIRSNWAHGLIQLVGVDQHSQTLFSRMERLSMSLGSNLAVWATIADLDMRALLPLIQCPTLVLHHRGNPLFPSAAGEHLARSIPDATFVELPGSVGSLFADPSARPLDHVLSFVLGEVPDADFDRVLSTVVFTDVVDSTATATRLGDREWKHQLETHDAALRRIVDHYRGRLVKTTGDGILATFDGPARAVRCSLAAISEAARLGIEIRAGVHTGEIELRGDDDIAGIAVHVAARVMAKAGAGQVWATRTVRDLVAGSGLSFDDRGSHSLKGVTAAWQLFRVTA
jgi:class 3 adenylate cyclase